MKIFFTLLISIFSLAAIAQVPEPAMLWLKGYSGNSNIAPLVSPQLDGGFVIAMGANISGGNIDSFCSLVGDRGIFLKYNSDASILEWTKCYFQNFGDSSLGYIDSTKDGNYILGGNGFSDTHHFLIHKEDAAGTILWSKSYGDSAEAVLYNMMATSDGGYILLGEVYYTNVDFPIHYGSSMNANFSVLKIDSSGNKVWSKVIGGTGDQIASSVVSAPNGGCYIVGTTTSNDYDCTGNHGNSDAYLARLDSNGNILWHNDLGGSGYDAGGGTYAYADRKGGIIIATSSGSNDGDVSHQIDIGGHDIWLIEVDSNNAILWNNCYGGGGYEYPNSVCKSTDGSIWVAGESENKGGEIDTAYGRDDAWFVHTDSIGNLINAIVLGSDLWDRGMMVYPLSNGNVIAGGFYDTSGGAFSSIITYDSYPNSNAFLAIFSPITMGVAQIINNNTIEVYPNPTNKQINIKIPHQIDENFSVEISNIIGKIVYKNTFKNNEQLLIVPINGWQTGMYFVDVKSDNGFNNVQKLIVQ